MGSTAISGGFDSPNFDGTFNVGATIEPYDFLKSGSRGWLVREMNFGVLDGTFVAYAYCGSGKVKTRSATGTVGPYPGIGTATASCKKGERVLSGGSESPGFNPD